jgi:hypothetical protein
VTATVALVCWARRNGFAEHELLEGFLRALRRIEAPVADNLAPGLSDEEIDALLEPVGITLPEEARVWWRWRNGPDPAAPFASTRFAHRGFISLQNEAGYYSDRLEYDGEELGFGGMLQPVTERTEIFFYCRVDRDETVPVYEGPQGEPPELLLPSIGALVRRWTEVLESGYVSAVTPDGVWHFDDERAPSEDQLIGFL